MWCKSSNRVWTKWSTVTRSAASPHLTLSPLLKFHIEPTIIIAPSCLVSYWTLDSPSGVLSQKAIRSWLAYPEVPMYVEQSPIFSPVMAKTVCICTLSLITRYALTFCNSMNSSKDKECMWNSHPKSNIWTTRYGGDHSPCLSEVGSAVLGVRQKTPELTIASRSYRSWLQPLPLMSWFFRHVQMTKKLWLRKVRHHDKSGVTYYRWGPTFFVVKKNRNEVLPSRDAVLCIDVNIGRRNHISVTMYRLGSVRLSVKKVRKR